jgi:hypothetical protein
MHPAVITPEEIERYRPMVQDCFPDVLREAAYSYAQTPSRFGQAMAATCRQVRREKLGLGPITNRYTEDA